MGLTRSALLVANAAGFGTGPYTPAAFTSISNSLLVVVAAIMVNAGSSDPSGSLTITDSVPLTWTARADIGNPNTWSCGMRVWTAPVTTGVSMTVTIDCGAFDSAGYFVQVFAWTGYNTSSPTGGTVTNSSGPVNGAWTLTLSATPASDSEVIAFIEIDEADANTPAADPGSGWTEIYDSGISGTHALESEVRGSSVSTDVVWADVYTPSGNAAKTLGMAIEIKAAAAGGVTRRELLLLGVS